MDYLKNKITSNESFYIKLIYIIISNKIFNFNFKVILLNNIEGFYFITLDLYHKKKTYNT